MTEVMFLCVSIAAIGALLRLLAETAGSKTAAKTIGTVVGLLIALTLTGAANGDVDLRLSFDIEDREAYFRSLSDETLDAVCAEAEKKLAENLSEELEKAFGAVLKDCAVSIDRESFDVRAVTVAFDAKDFFLSTYEVKKYVCERCGVEAEVYFE